jgi:PAS domain S-box-containing protein
MRGQTPQPNSFKKTLTAMRKFFSTSGSIYRRLLLAFVLVVLTPALIIGTVSGWSSYQIGQQRTFAQLDSVVTLKTAAIDMWTEELDLGLDMLVDDNDLQEGILPLLDGQLSAAEARRVHESLLANLISTRAKIKLFDRVILMDANGEVILSTDPAYESRDFRNADFYLQGLQKPFITSPFLPGPRDKFFTVVVSRPIVAPGQGAVGVLAGYSTISVLEKIMMKQTALGQTGESYLVGENYIPFTPLRSLKGADYSQIGSNGIHSAIEDKVRGRGFYSNYDGVPVLGVYTWLPTLRVALVVEQEQSEAFRSVTNLLIANLVVALLATALTVFVAFFVTRGIARPIRVLSATADQIAAGNLDLVAEVNRQDEIGRLAKAFNFMTSQLRKLIDDLQTELAERKRSEKLQSAIYRIAEAAQTTDDLPSFYKAVHEIICGLMPAENFYITLYDPVADLFNVVYKQEEGESETDWMSYKPGKGLGAYLLRTGQPILTTPEKFEELEKAGEVEIITRRMVDFIGVPLKSSAGIIGIMATQTYSLSQRLTEADKDVMVFVSTQVATAIERKQAEEALRVAEEKYRNLIEQIPAVVYLDEANESSRSFYISPQVETMLGYSPSAYIEDPHLWHKQILPEDYERAAATIAATLKQGRAVEEYRLVAMDGRTVWVRDTSVLIRDEAGQPKYFQGLIEDITDRKLAERLQASTYEIARASVTVGSLDELYARIHKILQTLLRTQFFYIALYNRDQDILTFPYFQDDFDEPSPPGKPGHGLTEYVLRTCKPLHATRAQMKTLIQQGEVELVGADSAEWLGVPLIAHEQAIGVMVVQSYDENVHFSRQDVEVMMYVSTQVASAIERKQAEESLRVEHNKSLQYFENAAVLMVVLNPQAEIVQLNRKGYDVLEYKEGELAGRNWIKTCLPARDQEQVQQVLNQLIAGQDDAFGVHENMIVTKSGRERLIRWHDSIILDANGNIAGTLGSGEDITEYKRAEQQVEEQLKRLSALHGIDKMINSSVDLTQVLDVFLREVINQLKVDAASILLYNQNTQTLSYKTSRGFRTTALQHIRLPLGEGYAGKVILDRQTLIVPDLTQTKSLLGDLLAKAGEKFIAYMGTPLTTRGQIVGVLEILHQSHLEPDSDWLYFLAMLAEQAAIAIDNAQLFDGLQQSNRELTMAYDATIAGWSRAMDLRDEETEGHTLRVADLVMRLAERMDVPGHELVHYRRGALLHDIGKLGVPDSILNKRGELTPKEWETMRMHPALAFEMLSSIQYLRPALDIPYCHHEKWDGSGYPRGLKGEQIPLAARLFAVVDVWDALTSDRPYRVAWTKEQAMAYLREQVGRHFDPEVVEYFLSLVENE